MSFITAVVEDPEAEEFSSQTAGSTPPTLSAGSDSMAEAVVYVAPPVVPLPSAEPVVYPLKADNNETNAAAPPAVMIPNQGVSPTCRPELCTPAREELPSVPIGGRGRTVKRVIAAVGLSVMLGSIGDFLRPLAPFNLLAFLVSLGLAIISIVVWARRGYSRHSPFGIRRAVLIAIAAVLGLWWGLASIHENRERGYLAGQSGLIGRVQSAIIMKVEEGPLDGRWSRDHTESRSKVRVELVARSGKLTWEFRFLQEGSYFRLAAEYGVTGDKVACGVVTGIENNKVDGKWQDSLPETSAPFSFRVMGTSQGLAIDDLKGEGLEGLKSMARGVYRRAD